MKAILSLVVLVAVFSMAYAAPRSSPLAGVTSTLYNGSMSTYFYDKNGYDDAKDACNSEFNDTHVCADAELAVIAQIDSLYQGNYRYIDMSLGQTASGAPVNDCMGFTSASPKFFSHCILQKVGGALLPSYCSCDKMMSFICCVDVNF